MHRPVSQPCGVRSVRTASNTFYYLGIITRPLPYRSPLNELILIKIIAGKTSGGALK